MDVRDYVQVATDSPSGLSWLVDRGCRKVGSPALTAKQSDGYYQGMICGKMFTAHRVVFFITHDYWPRQVDHVDGNRQNNTPNNLRAVDNAVNQHNRVAKGHYFNKATQTYQAQICVGGKMRCVGRFATAEEAHAAYLQAKAELHPTAPTRCYS